MGHRQRGLSLPSIEQARSEFEQYIGDEILWPDVQLPSPQVSYDDWPEKPATDDEWPEERAPTDADF